MNRLLEIGFQPVGHWYLSNGEIAPDLKEMPKQRQVLYAFVYEGEIQYIGRATQPLSVTMLNYQRPASGQSAKLRNRSNIRDLLSHGKKVDILALPDNGLLQYGGFPINLAAGLEDGMIARLQPPWNLHRPAKLPSEETTLKSEEEQAESQPGQSAPPRHTLPLNMPLTLQETYWNRGFFNVPIQYAQHFGGDLEKINMLVPHHPLPIVGYISRTANSNGTPRIMGGRELLKWFRRESRPMGKINVEILSPTSIVLTPLAE